MNASKPPISVDQIASKASRGEDISACFTNKFKVVKPIHLTNNDPTNGTPRQPDKRSTPTQSPADMMRSVEE